MAHVSELIASDIDAYLAAHQHKSLLRFITCGSVDDGKSTLIGRLLYESKMIFEDQLEALTRDSQRVGTRGGEIDFALLVDGLSAEREQGITIDVAYRFFSTDKRKFIVADTPGHEQYTRNMVTGASTADLAIILVDARKGLLTQTRRHSYLVSLLGIRRVVLAVNKMDLVGYEEARFAAIEREYRAFAARLGFTEITAIPMSAVQGDNIVERGPNTPWYTGPSLMPFLETVPLPDEAVDHPLRLPVQWVNRPSADFRGFCGLVASGAVRRGDAIRVLPSGRTSTVARVLVGDREAEAAQAGESITLTLADEIDVSRGDVITAAAAPLDVADRFEATVVWMSDEPMVPGRAYLLKHGGRLGTATLSVRHAIDVNTLEHVPATTLALNAIGTCTVEVDRPLPYAPYAESRALGGFIVIDRVSNGTVGAGLLHRAERGAAARPADVDRRARAAQKQQRPCVVWLGGAAAETVARRAEQQLVAAGAHTYVLVDAADRAAELAARFTDAGLIVLVAAPPLGPAARAALPPDELLELSPDALPADLDEAARSVVAALRARGVIP